MIGSQNGVLYDQNGCAGEAHSSPYGIGDFVKPDHSVPQNGSANGKVGESNCVLRFGHSTREVKSSEKQSDRFFMDENVVECEHPDLTVCYQENSEHVVKDICVDEGVPCGKKILSEHAVEDCQSNGSCPSFHAEEKTNLLHEELDTDISLSNGGNGVESYVLDKDSATLCNSNDLVKSGEPNSEATNMKDYEDKSYSACRNYLMEKNSDSVRNGSDIGFSVPHGQKVSERNELNKDSAALCSSLDLEKSGDSEGHPTNMIEDYGSNGCVVDELKCDSDCSQSLTERKSELVEDEPESETEILVLDEQTVSNTSELEKDCAILLTSEDFLNPGELNGNMHDNSVESIVDEYRCDNSSQHYLTEQKSELVKEGTAGGNLILDGPTVLDTDELNKNFTMICSSKDLVKSGESNGEKTKLTEDNLSKEGFVNHIDDACQNPQMGQKTDLEEKSYTDITITDEAMDSVRIELEIDAPMINSANESVKSEKDNTNDSNMMGDDKYTHMTPPVALSPLQETSAGNSDCKSNAYDSKEINMLSNQLSNDEEKLGRLASVSTSLESGCSADEAVGATFKSSTHENSRKITFSGELSDMEEDGSITFDFDSSARVPSSRGDFPHDNQPKNLDSQNAPDTQNGISNARSVLYQDENSHGETSFSMAGPTSSSTSYSVAIPYSGSISVRSDGSATSARSFAFPVLQPDWNSSPARMARADRRALQKHRRWRYCLLCCRF